MQTNKLIYVTIFLQVIIIILCGISLTQYRAPAKRTISPGMHMMPDGSMMSSHGDMMRSGDMMGSGDTTMNTMMMNMTASMKGKTGDALDKVFLEEMIVHHQGAVDMAMELQKGTKRPELQKMAQDIITAQSKEITMMKQWLKEWFPAQ